jgi:selenocysteine lyase/cysteine desulfurase
LEDDAWADVRAQFILEAGTAYMNNASLGMPPAAVAEAVGAGYELVSREPIHAKHELRGLIANRVMPGLATLFGADSDELVLTRNASEALYISTTGIDLESGDEVLVTSQEHPAGRQPWDFRAANHGVRVNTVSIPSPFESGDQVVELIEAAITPGTKVIAFCHVTRGGHLYPVKKLAVMARDRGILTHVDGAQAVGMFPVDLHDLGCDTYSASLHKWLLGPIGTGFFYIRRGARDRIRSIFTHDGTPQAPEFGPLGTVDLPVRAGIAAALDTIETIGADLVETRTRTLSDYLKACLSELPDVTLLSGTTPETSCPGSTIFEMEGVDAVASVGLMVERIQTHIDEHQRDGHNAIRVSTHIYNTKAEIDRLVEGLVSLRG